MAPHPTLSPTADESITTMARMQRSVIAFVENLQITRNFVMTVFASRAATNAPRRLREPSRKTERGVDPSAVQLRITRESGHVTISGDPTTRCGGQERRPRLIRSEALGPACAEQRAGFQPPLLHLHTSLPARSVKPPRLAFGEAHSLFCHPHVSVSRITYLG
jgi:hypothetical protein